MINFVINKNAFMSALSKSFLEQEIKISTNSISYPMYGIFLNFNSN